MPDVTLTELGDCVRLDLGGIARGQGRSLQEAADDLIYSILRLLVAFRATGFTASRELPPDLETLDFLSELGELAAAGGDIRSRVFA